MFNNYAIVQGADHIVPVDIYLPGCPPRPEMLIDAILKVRAKAGETKIGAHREAEILEREQIALAAEPTSAMKGLLR
jgi:NADH-quinone oxidoreductase subunit B